MMSPGISLWNFIRGIPSEKGRISMKHLMKKLDLILLTVTFIILLGCKSNDQGHSPEELERSRTEKINRKKKILSVIHGGWVLKKSMDILDSNLSINKAFPEGQPYPELIIDSSETVGDTVPNFGNLMNGKEGHHFKVVIENYDKPELKLVFNHNYVDQNHFLSYRVESKDTLLLLTKKNLSTQQVL